MIPVAEMMLSDIEHLMQGEYRTEGGIIVRGLRMHNLVSLLNAGSGESGIVWGVSVNHPSEFFINLGYAIIRAQNVHPPRRWSDEVVIKR